jgi:hypothetical protein
LAPITDTNHRATCGYRCGDEAATRDSEHARPRYAQCSSEEFVAALLSDRQRLTLQLVLAVEQRFQQIIRRGSSRAGAIRSTAASGARTGDGARGTVAPGLAVARQHQVAVDPLDSLQRAGGLLG